MVTDLKREGRAHSMPFGTTCTHRGVLFRLWAPGAETVDLALEVGGVSPELTPMEKKEEGWFEIIHPEARPGSLYRFRIDGDLLVPDPVSRGQSEDIHGPSVVVDPHAFVWQDHLWFGRPWEEAVICEIHVGTFTEQGDFRGVVERLDYLKEVGVTAIELMPVADFPGERNWGYDGALLFAPDSIYGSPADLKNLIQEAHAREMMVFLDVVYNHFGPEGNYLYVYARQAFFDDRYQTPWGSAINFSGPGSRTVRDFFVHNALYWLEEYGFDGLRLDAVHAIYDSSRPDILEEIAEAVRRGPARERHIHLVLENDGNESHYLVRGVDRKPALYAAQWNDDIHHALHVLITGEREGYYLDYADAPIHHLGRCLTEGFAYQGEPSPYRNDTPRGEPSGTLPPAAFVPFLQNHDQIGNRAFGERLTVLADGVRSTLAEILILLAPSPPLFFMGEEFGATTPFLYFCDFEADLGAKVTEGRRQEFARFPHFTDPEIRATIPDPNSRDTFARSGLNWDELESEEGARVNEMFRSLLRLRSREIVPRLAGMSGEGASCTILSPECLTASWLLGDGTKLRVSVNFSTEPVAKERGEAGSLLFAYPASAREAFQRPLLPPESIIWSLRQGAE